MKKRKKARHRSRQAAGVVGSGSRQYESLLTATAYFSHFSYDFTATAAQAGRGLMFIYSE